MNKKILILLAIVFFPCLVLITCNPDAIKRANPNDPSADNYDPDISSSSAASSSSSSSSGPSTYRVYYNGNGHDGGMVPIDTNSYLQSAFATVLNNTGSLTRYGFSFDGWTNAAGADHIPGNLFPIGTSDITLYVKWTALPRYTVSYNGNGSDGGTVPTDSSNYLPAETVYVLGNTGSLTKYGFYHDGWSNSSGASYAAGNNFAMGSVNTTLYAIWTPSPRYIVSYDGNGSDGGTAPTDSSNYLPTESVTVLGNTGSLTKVGFMFGGWSNSAGTIYQPTSTFPMASTNVTLYAKWLDLYSVSYSINGGTGSPPTDGSTYTNGQSLTAGDGSSLTKDQDGITMLFVEWNDTADGSGNSYANGGNVPMGASNLTLFAQYETNVLRKTGPGGGIIFYDKGYYSAGWRYMEVAPQSTEWINTKWGINMDMILGTKSEMGCGVTNTSILVGYYPGSNYAANRCDELVYGGQSDWFLPSEHELERVYSVVHLSGLGNFGTSSMQYWTSRSGSQPNSCLVDFNFGGNQYFQRENGYTVRAVRAF